MANGIDIQILQDILRILWIATVIDVSIGEENEEENLKVCKD